MHKETYVTMASPTGGDSQVHRQVISYSREDEAQKPSQPEEHALWVLVGPRSRIALDRC